MKLIQNAIISDGTLNGKKRVDILFDNKIKKISEKKIEGDFEQVIDLNWKLLIPGCIDAHVHFNDPGYTHHEDFLSGTTAAAIGGITTIVDMPCTSVPEVVTVSNLKRKVEIVDSKALIDYAFWGGIRSNDLPLKKDVIQNLWEEGVVGFKIYTISGMESFKALTYTEIEMVFSEFPEILFAFHAEDPSVIKKCFSQIGDKEHKSPNSFVKMRPVEAELTAVKEILQVNRSNKIHFVHISSEAAAKSIIQSKKSNDISFETCPHYLEFVSDDLNTLKGKLKTAPPVKYKNDREFLQNCLKKGFVDFITTDHAGCDYESEKNAPRINPPAKIWKTGSNKEAEKIPFTPPKMKIRINTVAI